jgi:probable phosphoglycerate mutase
MQQGKAKFGTEFLSWQKTAHEFIIDGHPPVRELWYRASLAWQTILNAMDKYDDPAATCLVVAHNAVNQGLIGTALGLPPVYFRRLLQSNAATSVLDFSPGGVNGQPRVTLDRLNQVIGEIGSGVLRVSGLGCRV